ncbi:MAG: betaine/proline/choline family ABC transporter ATP-binding protein [Bacillota bacterium]|nr:betaine/proline/choline family ABC transporter ATP-binding protein [Bacillota bacterium]
MIRLEGVTKVYPGQGRPAVDELDLEVGAGQVCVLVGPSGCGKTTTLKMINRLIEPSGGRILIDDRDVTQVDPVALRRTIGYVIQEIGLFPHMTVAENVAVVPRLLRWSPPRIRDRTAELLELVGLAPDEFSAKYPRQLSGGQKQRVGVARALAADPPLLLMDEPFGAIDPITRERLQNEFLDIQGKLHKTVVFVTHDINEGLKVGDTIAVMREGRLVQHTGPRDLLACPADEFVADFVGADRALKRLHLIRVGEVMEADPGALSLASGCGEAVERLRRAGRSWAYVVDDGGRLAGYASDADLERGATTVREVVRRVSTTVYPAATVADALTEMLTYGVGSLGVVDERGVLRGVISLALVQDVLQAPSGEEGAG